MNIRAATLWPPVIPPGLPFPVDGFKDKILDAEKDPGTDSYLRLTLRNKAGRDYRVNLIFKNGDGKPLETVIRAVRNSPGLTLPQLGELEVP
jgi:hypothetical protein